MCCWKWPKLQYGSQSVQRDQSLVSQSAGQNCVLQASLRQTHQQTQQTQRCHNSNSNVVSNISPCSPHETRTRNTCNPNNSNCGYLAILLRSAANDIHCMHALNSISVANETDFLVKTFHIHLESQAAFTSLFVETTVPRNVAGYHGYNSPPFFKHVPTRISVISDSIFTLEVSDF